MPVIISQTSATFRSAALRPPASVRPRGRASARQARTVAAASPAGQFLDYYRLLDVSHESTIADIKKSYRHLQKRCHPDISGNELGHEMAILLNEAYSILMDPAKRQHFDKMRRDAEKYGDYTGEALSQWSGPQGEERATFVDEGSCIGCLKCALQASSTFAIEMRHGKARTVNQWGDSEEDIEQAISICPVSCIHWVGRSDLPSLEYAMRREMKETNGQPKNGEVFDAAASFLKKREANSGGVDGQAWQAWASALGPFTPAGSRQTAASSIHRRAQGGSSSWWHVMNRGRHSATESCAIVLGCLSAPSGSQMFSASSEALEYLLQAAQSRARQSAGPAYTSAFTAAPPSDSEDYWQRQEGLVLSRTESSDAGQPRINQGFVHTRSSFSSRRNVMSKEALEERRRVDSRNMMVLGAMVCFMVWQMSSTVPEAITTGQHYGTPMSSAECYRRGGGVCRFFIN